MMLGNNSWGFAGDRFGRKKVVIGCSAFIAVFGLLSAFATSIAELAAARFFVGFGAGGVSFYEHPPPPPQKKIYALAYEA